MRFPSSTRPIVIRLTLLVLLSALLAPLSALAEDWPHWRGPRYDGTSTAIGVVAEWDRQKNVRWRLPLPGAAASTPIVVGERIILTTTAGEGSTELAVMAVNPTGKMLWQTKISEGAFDFTGGLAQFKEETNPASPSPTTDGESIWAFFGTGTLVSLDLDGKELWRTDIVERYGKFELYFGLSMSPFVSGGHIYLQLLNTHSQLVLALDKTNGKEVWKQERPTDAQKESLHSYTSPFTYRLGDQELLLVHGADYVTGHKLDDGTELWRHGGLNDREGYNPMYRLVATPVFAEGLLVVPTAKRGPVYGLKIDGAKGDITGAEKHTVWHLEKGTPDVPSPLVHDGLVYLSGERGTLNVLDAKSGEELYGERVHASSHRGSPVYADGKIYLTGTDGTVSVVKAGRTYELLSQNKLADERLASSLAIAGDTIYLRTYQALYAIGSN